VRSEGRALKGWKRQFKEGPWVCGYDSVGRKAQNLWVLDSEGKLEERRRTRLILVFLAVLVLLWFIRYSKILKSN